MADVPCVPLPEQPSLEQLRKQAKDLRRAVLAGDQEAVAEAAARYPDALAGFPLRAAQLVVARRYGFPSWTRLKRHVEIVTRYSRFPDRVSTNRTADTFLRLACLSYGDTDGPGWREEAHRIIDVDPGLATGNVHVAAVAADVAELRRILAADPGAAKREGGPFLWEPLVRGRGRSGAGAAASALAGPRPPAPRSRRRPQRRAGAVQPDVRAGQRPSGAVVRVRPRHR